MNYFLEKKHFQVESNSNHIVRSPDWISNGHWLLHKSQVMNFDMFFNDNILKEYLVNPTIREVNNTVIETILQNTSDKKWVMTHWQYHENGNFSNWNEDEVVEEYSAYAFKHKDEILFINSLYVELFHIYSHVYANSPRSPAYFGAEQPMSLVMPMLISNVPDFVKNMLDGLTQLSI